MTGPPGGLPPVLTVARWIVRGAARLVPAERRPDWQREWDAELQHRFGALQDRDLLSADRQAALLVRSLGSVADALQLRFGDAQEWGEGFAAVAARWGERSGSVVAGLLFLSLGIAADALLLAYGRLMVGDPESGWSRVVGDARSLILAIAVLYGVSLIAASALAAARLLGHAPGDRADRPTVAVVEMLLIAGVTAWVGRWFAAFGTHALMIPQWRERLAPADPGGVLSGAWLVCWILGLAALALLRAPRRHARGG